MSARTSRLSLLPVVFVAAVAVPSCGSERPGVDERVPPAPASAPSLLSTLRARFAPFARALDAAREARRSERLRVEVPLDARGELIVSDSSSSVGARLALEGAVASAGVTQDGVTVYPEAGVVMRETAGGVEDYVFYERKPTREEARYTLTPSTGTALRLVGEVLELVDSEGTPRVRMAAPWLADARGARLGATVGVEGCAFDANPAPPWGRHLPAPGAARCTVVVRWSGAHYPALLDPNWATTTGSMSSARSSHVAVKLESGRVLVTYGESCEGSNCLLAPGSGELYDPTTKTFAATGSAGGKVSRTAAALLGNGKALVMGPSGVGGQLYTQGTGLFTDAGASTVERSGGSTLTLLASGKALAAGGAVSPQVELYDPTANTFTLGPALKTNRSGHTATRLADGKVLLAGGNTETAELYDPVSNTTTLTGSMSIARTSHAAARLANGKVLVVGGAQTSVAELYDPAAGTFAATGSLSEVRLELSAVSLTSGNVYVIGGYFPSAPIPLASPVVERYDPATGKFDLAPFLLRGRASHRATLLDDGALLATGGVDSGAFARSLQDGELLALASPGAVCARGDDCATGICDQGICCAAACTDTCRSCAAGTGACALVKGADDPSSCTDARTCDAEGVCKKKQGRACAVPSECASGACVDGVCCDRACTGVCEACDGAVPGRCEVVAGKPHGARTCPSDGSICGGACGGTVAETCGFAGEATGCGTTCEGSTRTAGACDGKGACGVRTARPCAGNFTCKDAESCRTRCANDAECAVGFGCTPEGKCTPVAACDGDHTVVGADGKSKTDCTPYRCDVGSNRCGASCSEVSGCAAPFVCDFTGQCVAPPKAPSGCAATGARPDDGDGGGSVGSLALALSALLASRRRGRRLPPPRAPVG